MESKANMEVEKAKDILRGEFNLKFEKVERKIDKVGDEVDLLDNKVDSLRDAVLPMIGLLQQTAENTKTMSEELKASNAEQRKTNGKFFEKLNSHDVLFEGVKGQFVEVGVKLSAQTEEKKMNAGLLTTVIVVSGGIVTAIFQFAPSLFNQ